MRKNYLFPTTFRKIGWCLFVPFAITSFICLFDGSNEDWLKVNALSVIPWGIIKNSLFDELSMIGLTVSLLFIAFSKEKDEDECIANIRSNSLIWATITAYSLLIVCTMLIYDMQYLNFVFIDLFMILFLVLRTLIWGDPVAGWPSMVCVILFMGGIHLLGMGIMGEYLSKTYLESKHRPIYIVRSASYEQE